MKTTKTLSYRTLWLLAILWESLLLGAAHLRESSGASLGELIAWAITQMPSVAIYKWVENISSQLIPDEVILPLIWILQCAVWAGVFSLIKWFRDKTREDAPAP